MDETGLPGRPSSSVDAEPAVHQRLAGPQGDAPEAEPHALAAQRLLHEVVLADRGAAEGDEDVGARVSRGRDALVQGLEACPGRCRDRSASPPAFSTIGGDGRQARGDDLVGPGGSPGRTSSSPVARIATRGLRRTGSVPWPMAAASAMRRASRRWPACSSASPARKSRPAGRMWRPGAGCLRRRSPSSPERSASSWMHDASAPSGTRRAGEDPHGLARRRRCR